MSFRSAEYFCTRNLHLRFYFEALLLTGNARKIPEFIASDDFAGRLFARPEKNALAVYERLRNLREDLDLTQAQIGECLHISQRAYAHYEAGTRDNMCALFLKYPLFYRTLQKL